MAKEKNNLDQFFKEKLENHTERPSKLAWERLESQLPQKSKSYKGIWWAAAASLTILFTVGYLVLREGDLSVEKPMLSDSQTEEIIDSPTQTETQLEIITQEKTDNKQTGTENQQAIEELKTKPTTTTKPKTKPADSSSKIQKSQPTTSQNLIAAYEEEEVDPVVLVKEEAPKIILETPEITPAELAPLEFEKAIAEVDEPAEEEPAYRVKIYSNGLTEEPKDKNLLAEIGKTVNEVEGLLGKVDQGFADLQDAKDNLFASITTRKTKAEK